MVQTSHSYAQKSDLSTVGPSCGCQVARDVTQVLIVDDDLAYAKVLKFGLESLGGIRVIGIYTSINEAYIRTIQLKPEVALVETCALDGDIEVADKLISLATRSRVLLVTDTNDHSYVRRAFGLPVYDFLSKELHVGEVWDAIRMAKRGLKVFWVGASHTTETDWGSHGLTNAELQLLRIAATGCDVQQMANLLLASTSTIKRRLGQIQTKLGVSNRTQAVVRAALMGAL